MSTDVHATTTHPANSSGIKHPYHLVDPSPWPICGALGGGILVFGIVTVAKGNTWIPLAVGLLLVLGTMTMWWRDVWKESATVGLHSPVVRIGL